MEKRERFCRDENGKVCSVTMLEWATYLAMTGAMVGIIKTEWPKMPEDIQSKWKVRFTNHLDDTRTRIFDMDGRNVILEMEDTLVTLNEVQANDRKYPYGTTTSNIVVPPLIDGESSTTFSRVSEILEQTKDECLLEGNSADICYELEKYEQQMTHHLREESLKQENGIPHPKLKSYPTEAEFDTFRESFGIHESHPPSDQIFWRYENNELAGTTFLQRDQGTCEKCHEDTKMYGTPENANGVFYTLERDLKPQIFANEKQHEIDKNRATRLMAMMGGLFSLLSFGIRKIANSAKRDKREQIRLRREAEMAKKIHENFVQLVAHD